MPTDFPVDETLTVHRGEDIYKTESWRKSVVQYHFQNHSDSIETAIYLWHNNDGQWTQKNKYVVKTEDAWAEDRETIQNVRDAPAGPDTAADYPVSDYYHVDAGETVFKTDDWWKAVVRVDEKGGYETEEIIIYVWQYHDGDWRRRQKYAIKDTDDWGKEQRVVTRLLEGKEEFAEPSPTTGESSQQTDARALGLEPMDAKAAGHLSMNLREGWEK